MNSIEFKKEQLSFLLENFNSAGVYSLSDEDKQILYIGKSSDLSKRVMSHIIYALCEDDFYADVSHINLFKTQNEVIASHLEVFMIETFNPPKNRISYPYDDWLKTIPLSVKNISCLDIVHLTNRFKNRDDVYSIDLNYFRG